MLEWCYLCDVELKKKDQLSLKWPDLALQETVKEQFQPSGYPHQAMSPENQSQQRGHGVG